MTVMRDRVGISEYRIATAPTLLVTYGLGSCLGIVIYDAESKRGGMAHTLLPSPRPGMDLSRMTKYVDASIELMVDEMVQAGSRKDGLVAKVFGGANMFEALQGASGETIGQRNIRSARETLAKAGVPLVAEDVGGNFGRTLEFNLETGAVRVRSVREDQNDTVY